MQSAATAVAAIDSTVLPYGHRLQTLLSTPCFACFVYRTGPPDYPNPANVLEAPLWRRNKLACNGELSA